MEISRLKDVWKHIIILIEMSKSYYTGRTGSIMAAFSNTSDPTLQNYIIVQTTLIFMANEHLHMHNGMSLYDNGCCWH